MTAQIIVVVAAATVLGVCVLFVLHSQYHSGLLGNVGLAFIAFVATARLLSIFDGGGDARVSPQGVLLWCGLALFLGRQAWTFLRRSRSRGSNWYDAQKRQAC